MILLLIRGGLLVVQVLDAIYDASICITRSDFCVFPWHLQPILCCWLPSPAFSRLMASASCCFVIVQMSEWCNKKEAGMKRGITAENYSHMLTHVAITSRLITQPPIEQAHAHARENRHNLLRTSWSDASGYASKHKRLPHHLCGSLTFHWKPPVLPIALDVLVCREL